MIARISVVAGAGMIAFPVMFWNLGEVARANSSPSLWAAVYFFLAASVLCAITSSVIFATGGKP